MRALKDVTNFGHIAAEDDDIKRFFVQTPVYDDLVKGIKQVVIGRKGAGKTALYLAMIERTDDASFFAKGLAFSDYPWALHTRYAHPAMAAQERYLPSWRFLTYIEIFKVLLTESRRPSRYPDSEMKAALGSVEQFIQKNWGVLAFDHKKTFPHGGFKLSGLSFAPEIAGFSLGGVAAEREGNLSETLDRLNEWLWNALQAVGRSAPRVYVLFDELDAGFDPASTDYIDRVIGLLLAVRKLSRAFQEADLPFKAIAFLRSDIYESLHFGDKNKLTTTNVTSLSWNDDLEYNACSLKQLLDHRIREAMDLPPTVRRPWERAFDGANMVGTQHKFNHMTFRSYLRPRDVIQFANCALDEFKRRTATAGSNGLPLITNPDIAAARKSYSRYLLKELDDEIAAGRPEWSEDLEVLRRIRVTRFTKEVFVAAYEDVGLKPGPGHGPDDLLAFFYNYSIIGFERAPGAGGLEWHFRYQDETVRFNPSARAFMVHRGLKEALELKGAAGAVEELD